MTTYDDINEMDIDVPQEVLVDDEGEVIDVTRIRIPDVITITARLAQLLAEEADLLESMKISKIADLQNEKKILVDALDAMKTQIRRQPVLLEEISDDERDDLFEVVSVFNQILEENYRRLTMARAVNAEVVQVITEAVQEASRKDIYDRKGENG